MDVRSSFCYPQTVIVNRGFCFRLDPSAAQARQMMSFAGVCRLVYNLALEQRRDFYRQFRQSTGRSISYVTQARELTELRAQPTLRVTPPYYNDDFYIEALAVSIEEHLKTLSYKPELIVASFHGMPKEYVDKGDPYREQCVATTELLRKRLGMDDTKLLLTFQSRFGFSEWLQPYTDKTIEKLAKDGVKRIAVVMPGFAADCLETLEEISGENCEIFKHNGGEEFSAVPCLNDSAPGMEVLRQLVLRELQGWL